MTTTTNDAPITDAELAEVKQLHAAATPGEWRYDGMHNEICTPASRDQYWLILSECRSAPDQAQKEEFGHGFDANFASIAALHNAFPGLNARLEAAEAYRAEVEAAKPTVQALLDSGETAESEVADLRERLEAVERERDGAKAEVARQWITLTEIAELVEDYADCDDGDDGIANRPNLAMQVQMMADKATQCNPQAYAWLAARDAQQRRDGAAEWLENKAKQRMLMSSAMMQEAAKRLREGK